MTRNLTEAMPSQITLTKLLVLLGLALTFTWMAHVNHIAEYDESLHLDVARSIYQTGVPIRSIRDGVAYLYHPPLFLYLLAPVTGPLEDGTLIGRWISGAFGLLSVAIVFKLVDELIDRRAAVLAGLLVALSPLFQIYAFSVQAEVMLTALILAGLLAFAVAWRTRLTRYAWLTGIMFALAVWVKFLAVLPIGACALYGLLSFRRRRTFRELLALIVPPSLALCAWVGFGLALDRAVFQQVMQSWFSGPQWPWDPRMHFTFADWLLVLVRDVLSYPGAILLLTTFPLRVRLYRRGSRLVVFEIYAMLMLIYSMFSSVKEVRHLIPLAPVAAILITSGVVELIQGVPWLRQAGWRRSLAVGVMVLALVEASPLTLLPDERPASWQNWLDKPLVARVFDNDAYLTNVRDAGQYLKQLTPADAVIPVVHEGTVAGYYANRRYVLLYVLSSDEIMDVVENSRWLLVDKDLYPNLNNVEVERVKSYIADHFASVARFATSGPAATVYQRLDYP